MKAWNSRNGRALSEEVIVARSAFARMRGLLGSEGLKKGEALLLMPCKGVHTIGMRFDIDIAFLSLHGIVVRRRENVPPNRVVALVPGAASALELPAGTLSITDTRVGDSIVFERT